MVFETERLVLRRFTTGDTAFIVRLLNEPSFIENIADRGVRTDDDARAYLLDGPLASYEKNGFGLWLVLERATGEAIGMCGLIRRDVLDDVDVGYAFLPEHWGKGYAAEAVEGTLRHGVERCGLARIVAVVNPGNERSISLLRKLGFTYERMVRLDPADIETKLFGWSAAPR